MEKVVCKKEHGLFASGRVLSGSGVSVRFSAPVTTVEVTRPIILGSGMLVRAPLQG